MIKPHRIQCNATTLDYHQKIILEKINCNIEPASLTFVIGRNGAGKSTLLRALANLQPYSGGSITINNVEVKQFKRHTLAKKLAWTPPPRPIAFELSCHEIVCLGRFAFHGGYPSKDDEEITCHVLEELGIYHLRDRALHSLSQGEQQKVFLARGLSSRAPIMLFDEPTSHLDIKASIQVLELLRRLSRKGHTVVCAIHDIALAYRFADQIIVLHEKSCVYAGDSNGLDHSLIRVVFGVKTHKVSLNNQNHLIFTE